MYPITFWFNSRGCLPHGDGRPVRVGETHTVDGEIKPCVNGLHSSIGPASALANNRSSTVWVTKIGGNIVHHDDKLVASERSYLYRVDVLAVLKQWARECALRVLPLARKHFSAVNYMLVEHFLLTGADALRTSASNAAYAAYAPAKNDAYAAYYATANDAYATAYAAYYATAYAAANAAYAAYSAANAANAAYSAANAAYAADAAANAADAANAAAYAATYAASAAAYAAGAADVAANKKELQWQNDRLETLIWEEIRSTHQPTEK